FFKVMPLSSGDRLSSKESGSIVREAASNSLNLPIQRRAPRLNSTSGLAQTEKSLILPTFIRAITSHIKLYLLFMVFGIPNFNLLPFCKLRNQSLGRFIIYQISVWKSRSCLSQKNKRRLIPPFVCIKIRIILLQSSWKLCLSHRPFLPARYPQSARPQRRETNIQPICVWLPVVP